MLFSANTFPVSGDSSAAWWDRWIVLPFERRFVGIRADPFKIERLTQTAELEGHLVLAIEAVREVMRRKRFTSSLRARKALRKYRRMADSVTAFLLERCVLAKNEGEAASLSIPKTGLYRAYRHMCEDEHRPPVSARNFYQRVVQVAARELGGCVAERKVKGQRRFRGLTLRTPMHFQGIRYP
jgi:putative DNA primase/helicase